MQFVQLVCSLCSLCAVCAIFVQFVCTVQCAICAACVHRATPAVMLLCAFDGCNVPFCPVCAVCVQQRAVCNMYSLCRMQFVQCAVCAVCVQFVQLLLNFPAFCRRECFSLTEGSGLRCKCFFTALSARCAPIFIFFLPEQLSNIYGPCGEYVANSLGAVVTVECKEKLRQLKDAVVREFTPNSSVSLY